VCRCADGLAARVTVVKHLRVRNAGWSLEPLAVGAPASEILAMRGYDVKKSGQLVLEFPVPGTYVIDDRL
jgi:hypothetical protein